MTTWSLITLILFALGYAFVASAYKGAFSRNKPDKQIENYFELGLFLVLAGVVVLAVVSYGIGQKNVKKETTFVIQKKLDDSRMEVLALDEDVRFEVKKDGVYILPIIKESISLSDVKEIVK